MIQITNGVCGFSLATGQTANQLIRGRDCSCQLRGSRGQRAPCICCVWRSPSNWIRNFEFHDSSLRGTWRYTEHQ
ncbi:hypothetical protein NDU88_009016 [Pleurodeles waltl]|uniref:Uncharacterized protein n=1 Tax=Pleurodeles waltl TaxID=8319 RepID=A0AAV7PR84_PLEWA|nr:hypothetical protein NDU88_009016 [Pleurodeles waltl]